MLRLTALLASFGSVVAADEACLSAPFETAVTSDEQRLATIVKETRALLVDFPTIMATLDRGQPTICFSTTMDGALAFLDIDANRIVLDESLKPSMAVGVVLHELRHLWQFANGICPTDDLSMKEYARATLAMEADASAISLLIAWTAKDNGRESYWNALSSWGTQFDIAEAFEETFHRTGDEELAVTAAFYQWYDSALRIDNYYVSTCSAYLDRQDESHAIPQFRLVPEGFFEDLCRMPDGSSYDCTAAGNAPK